MNILITRPEKQGQQLVKQCKEKNHNAFAFPLVKITPIFIDPLVLSTVAKQVDIVVFISPNAIEHGIDRVLEKVAFKQIAVIGKGSLQRLQQQQINCNIYPESEFTSEGLLKHPKLQAIKNQKILIVRGEGGREKLKNELTNRGAIVSYLDVYKRTEIKYKKTEIEALLNKPIDIVQISNQQTLSLLMPIIKNAQWKNHCQWWLLSNRTKKHCLQYGIKEPLCRIIQPGNDAFIKNL